LRLEGLNSCLISWAVLNTAPRLARTWHTSRSGGARSSRVFGLLKLQFPHPVKGEPVQKGGVVGGAAHPKELPFEALIGLLKEGEKDFPRHVAKAHPAEARGYKAL